MLTEYQILGTSTSIKMEISWEMMLYSPLKLLHVGFLLGIFVNHEDGGDIFL
jgi:hypothetical protein